MSIEQGGTDQVEQSSPQPVINQELLEKLYENKASLLDGVTRDLSAEELKNIYEEIFKFQQDLSDKHSDKGLTWLTPEYNERREKQEYDGKFINQLEKSISRDFLQTHGLAQAFQTYKETRRDNVLEQAKIIQEDFIEEITFYIQNAPRAKTFQGLEQLSAGDKLLLLQILTTKQTLSTSRGHERDFQNLTEIISTQSNSPFADFIIKYCTNLNAELKLFDSKNTYYDDDELGHSLHNASVWSAHENNDITNAIRPDEVLTKGEQIIRIAKDTLAIIDSNGTPRAYAYISEEKLVDKQKLKLNSLDSMIELYSPWEGYQKDANNFSIYENMEDLSMLIWNLNDINNQIIRGYYQIELNDFKGLGEIWFQISPVLTALEWEQLFKQSSDYLGDYSGSSDSINGAKYKGLIKALNEKINPQYTQEMRQWLEKIRPEIEAGIPKVKFHNYQELTQDRTINPFSNAEDDLVVYFSFIHNPVFQIQIEKELNIDLIKIDLNSQIHLLRFLVHADQETYHRFVELMKYNRHSRLISYNVELHDNFLKSFLTCADDLEFGKRIMDIYEQQEVKHEEIKPNGVKFVEYDQEALPAIFAKYAEIVDAVENVRSYLQENYRGATDNQAIDLIIQNLLRKGKDLLADFADNPRGPEEIIIALENYRTETLIFASTCRALKQEGQQVNLEDFTQYGVDVLLATEIVPEDRRMMAQILNENWQEQDPKIAPYVLHDLQESFKNTDSRFYILRYNNQILGFKRFDNLPNKDLYAGSFNINSQLRRSGIGEAAMRAYLNQEASKHVIHANTSPFTPITMRYIGEFGFVGTNIEDIDYEGNYFSGLGMERNDQINNKYRFNKASYGEIAKNYQNGELDKETNSLVILVSQEELLNQMRQILLPGEMVLTAYRQDPDNENQYLLAFEKKIPVKNQTENSELVAV